MLVSRKLIQSLHKNNVQMKAFSYKHLSLFVSMGCILSLTACTQTTYYNWRYLDDESAHVNFQKDSQMCMAYANNLIPMPDVYWADTREYQVSGNLQSYNEYTGHTSSYYSGTIQQTPDIASTTMSFLSTIAAISAQEQRDKKYAECLKNLGWTTQVPNWTQLLAESEENIELDAQCLDFFENYLVNIKAKEEKDKVPMDPNLKGNLALGIGIFKDETKHLSIDKKNELKYKYNPNEIVGKCVIRTAYLSIDDKYYKRIKKIAHDELAEFYSEREIKKILDKTSFHRRGMVNPWDAPLAREKAQKK